jgi:hypothetical protein
LISERFNPTHEWDIHQSVASTRPALTTQEIVAQIMQMAQMIPHVAGTTVSTSSKKVKLEKLKGAYLEALDISNVFLTDLTLERATANTPAGPQDVMKQEVLWQRWEIEK